MVRECAVLAIEGPDRLTTLKAFVVLGDGSGGSEETTRALQDYVKGRLLPYKYPRIVVYLNELPKTGSGKIDRQSLAKGQFPPAP
jgi:acyl-coenzyme A synthetase/AMP-(fatty) acid ligase